MATKSFRQFIWENIYQYSKEALNPVLFMAKSFCVLHLTNSYIFTTALALGPSMLPTLNLTGDFLLVDRISTQLCKVGPGDIVMVRSPENPRKVVVKRVVGMEGQRVSFVAKPKESSKVETVVVPKGHVWIEGDNIYDSSDSRRFGPVPYALIQGRVFWRIWPPKAFGALGQKQE